MQPNRILIHYAEVALKGRNRRDFEVTLKRNIKHRLRRQGLHWPVHRGHSRITVHVPAGEEASVDDAVALLTAVAGVASVAPAIHLSADEVRPTGAEPDLEGIRGVMLGLAEKTWQPGQTFAVRVRRADKGFPVRSDVLARDLGATLIARSDWEKVDLGQPDRAFHVDIYPEGAYLYAERHKGMGGLPVFSGGHVLSLLSGGIDSPVSSWMMAKRGCRVDFLHMTATHVAASRSDDNLVSRIARHLSRYTLRSRLYLVPYTHFDMALIGHPATGHETVLFRRFMARLATRIADRLGAEALVTGDSLGQVASQTLENMVSSSRATPLPVLRPLIGLDKQEIVDRARAIGTFELSTQPYKDCCALLSRKPRTRSRHDDLEALEAELFPDYESLIEATLAEAVVVELDTGERVEGDTAAPAFEPVQEDTP